MNTRLNYIGRAFTDLTPGQTYDVVLTGLEVTIAREGFDVVIQYHTILNFLKDWELPGTISEGVDRIAAERRRQITELGYTTKNDASAFKHDTGLMGRAAAAYALPDNITINGASRKTVWPWAPHNFKPGTRLRELEKAGALIAAEIDIILYRERSV